MRALYRTVCENSKQNFAKKSLNAPNVKLLSNFLLDVFRVFWCFFWFPPLIWNKNVHLRWSVTFYNLIKNVFVLSYFLSSIRHEFCNIIQNGYTEYVLSFPLNKIRSIHVCFPYFAPPFAAFNSSIIDPMEFILIQVSTASAHCKVLPHSVSIFS